MKKLLFPITLLCSLCMGCGASVPMATTYPFEIQQKMQAARHWEILAGDVAGQVKRCLSKNSQLGEVPVYVVPETGSPFETIFHEFLISELMDHDLAISMSPENALALDYHTSILEHSDRYYQKVPFKFTALGTGIIVARNLEIIDAWMDRTQTETLLGMSAAGGILADVAMSYYGGEPSSNEVIITTSLTYDDELFLHQSDIYYINDPDVSHYTTQEPVELNGRTFNVVN